LNVALQGTAGTVRLHLRCVLWGLATGAVVAGATGGLIGALANLGFPVVDLFVDAAVGAIVGILDALLLTAISLWGDGFPSLVRSAPFVGAGTAAVGIVLGVARESIARAWLHT